MKRAVLLLALLAGGCAATPTPTRDELAEALTEEREGRAPAASTDITHVACHAGADNAPGVACRWRQRDGREWRDWQSHLALSETGWHLVDVPTRRP